MIRRIVSGAANTMKYFAAVAVIALAVSAAALPATGAYAADPTYSCGSYGAGAYSSGGESCATTSGGDGITDPDTDTDTENGVGAPNTGFAKFMEPTNLLALIGSLALLVGGIILLIMARGKKKHGVSFKGRG